MTLKLTLLTSLTMVAFAANSIFCRLALVDEANDPMSFTLIRLLSGAVILLFFFLKHKSSEPIKLNRVTMLAPTMLFSYALFFSLSYVRIDAGTGALILFASVQLTMMAVALLKGQRLKGHEIFGIVLAMTGFVYLLLPGVNMPPVVSAALMAISGISWGLYSLLGQGATKPVFSTSRNFVFTAPLVILLALTFSIELTRQGLMWAILSGAITSGMGYVLWYIVLRDLVTSTAAIVQLSVPAIAAFGGALFLGEIIHLRLIIASALIFAGIFIKVRGFKRTRVGQLL